MMSIALIDLYDSSRYRHQDMQTCWDRVCDSLCTLCVECIAAVNTRVVFPISDIPVSGESCERSGLRVREA